MQIIASAFGIQQSVSEDTYDETLTETDKKIYELSQKEFNGKMGAILSEIYDLPNELRAEFIRGLLYIEGVGREAADDNEVNDLAKKAEEESRIESEILETIGTLFPEEIPESIDVKLEELNHLSEATRALIRVNRKAADDSAKKDPTLNQMKEKIESYISSHNDLVSKYNRIKEDAETEIKTLEKMVASYNETAFTDADLQKIHVKMGFDKDDMRARVEQNDKLHADRKQRLSVLKMNLTRIYDNFQNAREGSERQLEIYISTYKHGGVQSYLTTIGTKFERPYDPRFANVTFTDIKKPLPLKL